MPRPLTVSELTRKLKEVLTGSFSDVLVRGEIAGFTAHRSGHWYFSVKDRDAVLNCVMFRGWNQHMRWKPRVGDEVLLAGQLDIYAPHGRYNLLVRRLRHAGEGDLQRRLEQLKAKLAAEGLFAPERKRPLPPLPAAIGVATSASGAALHDIIKVLDRRFPSIPVILASCRVQGEGAAAEIVAAVRALVDDGRADVIIVGRGGGSQEDLMAFNDEALARALAACPVPVVSAVGHETDVSIADLVADVRAATPSHAAELVAPERDALLAWVGELQRRLTDAFRRDLQRRRQRLDALRLRHPGHRINEARIRCDELSTRLARAAERDLAGRRRRLAAAAGRLDALSPLAVLERGYAVALLDGRALRDAGQARPGDRLQLRLHRGSLDVEVRAVHSGGPGTGPPC